LRRDNRTFVSSEVESSFLLRLPLLSGELSQLQRQQATFRPAFAQNRHTARLNQRGAVKFAARLSFKIARVPTKIQPSHARALQTLRSATTRSPSPIAA
jgi:hypothetical protein